MRSTEAGLVAALAAASFAYGAAQSVVAPLLPLLGHELGVRTSTAAWLLTGFVIVASVVAPIVGRLGDMFGRTRVLRIVMLTFFASSVLAVFGTSFPVLVTARSLQGVSSAIFPLAYGILRERLGPREIAGAAGIVSAGVGVGGSLGVAGAGAIAHLAGTRGTFLIVALVVGAATLAAFRIRAAASTGRRERVDIAGGLLMAAWVSGGLLVVTALGQGGAGPAMAVVGVLALAAFLAWILVERRAPSPLVDLRLMTALPVLCGNVLAFLFAYVQFSVMVTVPAFVQAPGGAGYGFAASVATAGLYIVPQTLAFLIVNLFTGRTSRWPGSAWCVLAAAVIVSAATAQLRFLHDHPWQILLASFTMGLGIGLMYSHLPTLLVLAVRPEAAGAVAGMNLNLRNIGGAVGAQVSAALLVSTPGLAGFDAAFLGMGVAALTAVPLAGAVVAALRRGAHE